jgi:cell division protein FtsB
VSDTGSRRLGARLVTGAILLVAVYYAVWGGEYSAFDLLRLHRQQSDVAARADATRLEVDSLRTVAHLLDSDSATIEEVAREHFGMIREGELLYRFVEVPRAGAAASAETVAPAPRP